MTRAYKWVYLPRRYQVSIDHAVSKGNTIVLVRTDS